MKIEDMPIGMLLSRAARKHMEKIHQSLERYGVQKTFGPILRELSIAEGKTQAELAEGMGISPPSMSVNLQKMEQAGFLIRKTDDEDMRQIRLFLTRKGKSTAGKAGREIAATDRKLVEALTQEEEAILKNLLTKILIHQGRNEA